MKHSLLLTRTLPNSDGDREKEIVLGFSWKLFFFGLLIPFVADKNSIYGWLMVTTRLAVILVSFILALLFGSSKGCFDKSIFGITFFILSASFWILSHILWASLYNRLLAEDLLERGYKPKDDYTRKILRRHDLL